MNFFHRLKAKAGFSHRSSLLICVLLLVAVTAGTFGRVVNWEFLTWDDGAHIYLNKLLDPPSARNAAQFWTVPFRAPHKLTLGENIPPYEQLYAPLTFSLYAALCDVARLETPLKTAADTFTTLNPATFHAANLLVHGANVLLVFALLRFLVRSPWAALMGALLFAVHPVQVEAVAWVTQLNTLLSTFFSLLTLLFWMLWLEKRRGGASSLFFYGAASLCFVGALLSKPLAVVVPLLAVVLAMWRHNVSWREALTWMAPWFVAAGAIVLINRSLQPPSDDALYVALWKRPFQVGDALAFYLAKLILPLRQTVDYTRNSTYVLGQWWGYLTGIVPLVVGWAAWRRRDRMPALWFGYCLFVLAASPTLGIVSYYYHWYSTVSDRYIYLSMLGAAVALAGAFEAARGAPRPTRAMLVAIMAIMASFWCFQSWRDSANWRNTQTLWEHTAAVNPRSWLAANNLANYYNTVGRFTESMAFYERSLSLKPRNPDANYNLGLLLDRAGRSDEAIKRFEIAAQITPRDPEIWNSLAVAFARRGDLKKAGDYWRRALALNGDYAEARINYGVALAMQGRDAEATVQWDRALQLQPDNPELHFNLGIALKKQGRLDEAAAHWRQALQLQPDYQAARRELLQLKP